MNSPTEEIEFLARSDHRAGVLDALADGPCDRRELYDVTGASAATMGRILADFEDRQWALRAGRQYELSPLGEFVAERFAELRDAMATQRELRDVWQWLPLDLDGFGIELFDDPVISRPGPAYPYEPVERVANLIGGTETMRGFGMAMVKASTLEAFFGQIRDGLTCEYVYPPQVFEEILAWDETRVAEAADRENYTPLLHDHLPLGDWCGVCLFDERVSFCCYEPETGMLRALIDTDAPETYDWAESVYERYQHEASPLPDGERLTPSNLP